MSDSGDPEQDEARLREEWERHFGLYDDDPFVSDSFLRYNNPTYKASNDLTIDAKVWDSD